jgi:hypothetical protein
LWQYHNGPFCSTHLLHDIVTQAIIWYLCPSDMIGDFSTWTYHISQYCFSLACNEILVCILNIHQWNKHGSHQTWPAFRSDPSAVCVHNIQQHMGVDLSVFRFVFDVVVGRQVKLWPMTFAPVVQRLTMTLLYCLNTLSSSFGHRLDQPS